MQTPKQRVRALRDVVSHSPVLVKGRIYEVEYVRGDELAVRAEGWRLVWVRIGIEVEEVPQEG